LIGLLAKRDKLKSTVDNLSAENEATNLAGFDAQERQYTSMRKEQEKFEEDRDNLKRLTSEIQTTVNDLTSKLSGQDSMPSGDLTRDFRQFKNALSDIPSDLLKAQTDGFSMPTNNQNIRVRMDDEEEAASSSDEDT